MDYCELLYLGTESVFGSDNVSISGQKIDLGSVVIDLGSVKIDLGISSDRSTQQIDLLGVVIDPFGCF